jgi:predicted nucleic acid-binding Zn ribbon protein
MKKSLLTFFVVIGVVLMFIGMGVLMATDIPDTIMIDNQGYKADKKGPVKFTHKAHTVDHKVACTECHHKYENGKNVWKEGDPVKKCADCHSPLKKQGKVIKLKNAYHKNCKNCHKKLIKAGKTKKAPFKKCNDCHAKKS